MWNAPLYQDLRRSMAQFRQTPLHSAIKNRAFSPPLAAIDHPPWKTIPPAGIHHHPTCGEPHENKPPADTRRDPARHPLHAARPSATTHQLSGPRRRRRAMNFDGTGSFKFALVNGTATTTYWSNSCGGRFPILVTADDMIGVIGPSGPHRFLRTDGGVPDGLVFTLGVDFRT